MTSMAERVAVVFSPCVRLYWKGRFGKQSDAFHPDTLADRALLQQFMKEAGVKSVGFGPMITDAQYDAVLVVAGKYGYCLETIGYPEDDHETA